MRPVAPPARPLRPFLGRRLRSFVGRPAERPPPGSRPEATAALAALTLLAAPTAAAGVMRGGEGGAPVVAAAAAMHGVLWAVRRFRLPGPSAWALVAYVLVVSWLALPATTAVGIPTGRTLRAAGERLGEALRDSGPGGTGVGPAGAEQGWLLLAVTLVAGCVVLADFTGFHLRRRLGALAPAAILLLPGALTPPARPSPLVLAACLMAALVFVVLARADPATLPAGRLGRTGITPATALPAGAGLAVVAVAGGLLAGPLLPGYGAPALVRAGAGGPGGAAPAPPAAEDGVALSALVDLRPSLTRRSAEEVFVVASPDAGYWRLASLDRFDGRAWSQSGRPDRTDADALGTGRISTQRFEIRGLRAGVVPAAYRPMWVAGEVDVDTDAGLVLRPRQPAIAGLRYEVTSVLSRPTARDVERLQPRAGPAPETVARFLAVPPDLPDPIRDLTRRVTAGPGPADPYGRALALQGWFRSNFRYDLDVGPGHGEDELTRFLFRTRRGYCEQFAAAYALMARVAGLPARVAVGFTPGEMQADGRYHVRGRHAHAWPEVYLDGVGWLAFEPTPGRGIPGAEAYTGVPAAQAAGEGAGADDPGAGAPPPTTGSAGGPVTVPASPTTTPVAVPTTALLATTVPDGERRAQDGGREPAVPWWPVLPAAAATVALAGAGLVPLAKAGRRGARRAAARTANQRVLVAWMEAEEALAATGVGRRPAETLLGHAARAAADPRVPPAAAEPLADLARQAGAAGYSGRELAPAAAEGADKAAAAVRVALRQACPAPRRLGRAVDPRPLLGRPVPARPVRAGDERP